MAVCVRDVMTREVLTVGPETTLSELDRMLLARGASGAPVVEAGAIVGLVSRSDVVRVLYDEQVEAGRIAGFYASPFPIPLPSLERLARDSRKIADRITRTRVREIMTRDVKSVAPDDGIRIAARMMVRDGYHRLVVVDGGRLVGIVTSLDLVRLVAELGLARSPRAEGGTSMDLGRARKQLEDRRRVLVKRTGVIEKDLRETREQDFAESVTEGENDEVLERLNESERAEIARIAVALRRIESGDYGTCSDCGGPIAEARLRAVPDADRCVGCA